MVIRNYLSKDKHELIVLFKQLDEKHSKFDKDVHNKIDDARYEEIISSLNKLDGNKFCLICEVDDKVIGFGICKLSKLEKNHTHKKRNLGEILYVCIKEKYKQLGIGRKLMQALENKLKNKGATKVELRVYSFNNETFPEKVGYSSKYMIYEKFLVKNVK